MRLRKRNLFRVIALALALGGPGLIGVACSDNDAEDAADEIGDAAEDAADDVEDALD